jgi:hypothetical protein
LGNLHLVRAIVSAPVWIAATLLPGGLQAQSYSVTTFIGSGGLSDGLAERARFNAEGVAVDRAGNVYLGDGIYGGARGGSTIRKITQVGTHWVVTTLAGQAGAPGLVDGTGSQARFNDPNGVGVDSEGNIYVTDQTDQFGTAFRKITPFGVVTTLARFRHPSDNPVGWGVAVDAADNVYMSLVSATTVSVRKITPAGVITVWATLDFLPAGMGFDPAGNLYLADTQRNIIRMIALDRPQGHARRRR